MCAYKIATKPIAGPTRDAPVVHVNATPRLFFYPAEDGTESMKEVELESSHGCIHMRPPDRNEAKKLGYFRAGVTLRVFSYDTKGPRR